MSDDPGRKAFFDRESPREDRRNQAHSPGASHKTSLLREVADFALNRDVEEAIAEQLGVAEREPRNPKPYVALGTFFQMQARVEDAALMFRHALALDPDFALAHQYLGQLLAAQGEMDGARHHAREAARCGNRLLLEMLDRYDSPPAGERES